MKDIHQITVGTKFDLDMYQNLEIIQDFGDKVTVKSPNGEIKQFYKDLILDFADIYNHQGLNKRIITEKAKHLTIKEREVLYTLLEEDARILKVQRDYLIVDKNMNDLKRVKKIMVNFLSKKGFIKSEGFQQFVLNPSYYQ